MFQARWLLPTLLTLSACARGPVRSASQTALSTSLGDPAELFHDVAIYAATDRGVLVPDEAHRAPGLLFDAWRAYTAEGASSDSHLRFVAAAQDAGLLNSPSTDPVLGMVVLEARIVAAREAWLDALVADPKATSHSIDLSGVEAQAQALAHTSMADRAQTRWILAQLDPSAVTDLTTIVPQGLDLFHGSDDAELRAALADALSGVDRWTAGDLDALDALWQAHSEQLKRDIVAAAALKASLRAQHAEDSVRWAERYAEAVAERCEGVADRGCPEQTADAQRSLGQATALRGSLEPPPDWQAALHATAWSCHLAHPDVQSVRSSLVLTWSEGWSIEKVSRGTEVTDCIAASLPAGTAPPHARVHWTVQPPS